MSKGPLKPTAQLFRVVSPPEPLPVRLDDRDVDEQLRGDKLSSLFLGQFEQERVDGALERFGLFGQLRELGYAHVKCEFHARGPFEHFLRIFDRSGGQMQLLGEVVLKVGRFAAPVQPLPSHPMPPLEVLSIEWILMQHVRGKFDPDRPRLPGQNHPGLGLGQRVVDLLLWVATLMEKDALLNMPAYFHNAVFYDRWFKFCDPLAQGEMEAIGRDLAAAGYSVADMSYAAYLDCIVEQNSGARFHWTAHPQIMPLAEKAKLYFELPEYARICTGRQEELSFAVVREEFEAKRPTLDNVEW